ncbi:MAG: hypothetical protein QNJ70_18270 [Xenococcaceae cyanobacterium MO_207.B15]|nr:hypothetical protein [Xenococcaceae cyanobacterium MO_207.B15]
MNHNPLFLSDLVVFLKKYLNLLLGVNFNWTREFSIFFFVIGILAGFGNTVAPIEAYCLFYHPTNYCRDSH